MIKMRNNKRRSQRAAKMAKVNGCGLKKGKKRERDEFEIAVADGSQREGSTLTD